MMKNGAKLMQKQPTGGNYGNYQISNFTTVNSMPFGKVAVFRHPIERLLSGWNQMFQDRCQDKCGKHPVIFLLLNFYISPHFS